MKIKTMKKIFRMSQDELMAYLIKRIEQYGYKDAYINWGDPVSGRGGYMYSAGTDEVMVVAHLDTVFWSLPKHILYDPELNAMMSPEGLGADDRAGVIGILTLLEKGVRPHILFTKDEEVGGIGAKNFAGDLLLEAYLYENCDNVKHIIELDRRGSNDAVFYSCGNKKYQKYIESFGFVMAYGTFSDICSISPVMDIASVNISTGYYDEHDEYESFFINELMRNVDIIEKIILDAENVNHFDYQQEVYSWKGYSRYYDNYGSYGYNDYRNYDYEYGETKSGSNTANGYNYDEFDKYDDDFDVGNTFEDIDVIAEGCPFEDDDKFFPSEAEHMSSPGKYPPNVV